MQYNANYVAPRDGNFRGIKLTLIVIQVIDIILSIIIISLGSVALGVASDHPLEKQIRTAGIIVITIGIIAILVAIIGLIGALKEHYYLVMTYGVITVLIAIASFTGSNIWYGVINLIVAGIAFYFAYLIHRSRAPIMA